MTNPSKITKEQVADYLSSQGFEVELLEIQIEDDIVRVRPLTYLGRELWEKLRKCLLAFWYPRKSDPMKAHFRSNVGAVLHQMKKMGYSP